MIINVLLVLMALAVVMLARTRNLLVVVVLAGIYSFLMGVVLVALDAVDVAMTEASVGAGISTVLLLCALAVCRTEEARSPRSQLAPFFVAATTGAVLVYGTFGLPRFSDAEAPIHSHVAPRYLQEVAQEIDIPNVVTAVLASYRGYDTLGETTVVFTAGVGVIALLRRPRRRSKETT